MCRRIFLRVEVMWVKERQVFRIAKTLKERGLRDWLRSLTAYSAHLTYARLNKWCGKLTHLLQTNQFCHFLSHNRNKNISIQMFTNIMCKLFLSITLVDYCYWKIVEVCSLSGGRAEGNINLGIILIDSQMIVFTRKHVSLLRFYPFRCARTLTRNGGEWKSFEYST